MNMSYSSDGIDSGMESGSGSSEQRKLIQSGEEDERSALMKQIQRGVSLKVSHFHLILFKITTPIRAADINLLYLYYFQKVDSVEPQKKPAGGLSGCLDQIKTGVDLKKVNPKK
jgi:hypothetical protein